MSSRSTICIRGVALVAACGALGCGEVRGRKKIQEANELYKRGRYQEAIAAFEAAEALVPDLPTLWLNEGYTCRQLIAPGGHDPESRRAADCALRAFRRLHELAPKDPRAEQLTVQTWFDIDDFATLETNFLERHRRAPGDYDVVHGLQEVYYKWGKWPQALEWSARAAALRPSDAQAQYGVGTFIWQILAGHGGGPDMAAYDPRPRPAADADDDSVAQRQKRRGKPGEPDLVPPPAPPAALPDDVTGKARVDLADQAIAHLEKAVALRPHYADAMTYLALVWRQKSYALFAEPTAWQQAVDRANDWQKRAVAERGGEELTVAFEAFRAQAAAQRPTGRKSLWYALSIAFHGALIAFGVAYSFWHVEELSPPLLKVTFMSAAPPPPPAAPPPAGGGNMKPKKPIVKPKIVQPTKPEIVQPKEIPKKEEPKEEPKAEDHGEKDGVKGGVIGGTPGGTIGGTPGGKIGGTPGGTGTGAPTAPKFLPPNIGRGQRIAGEEKDIPFAPSLRRPGMVYRVLAKICVNVAGGVDKVTIMKGADPLLDEAVVSDVKSKWRYRPLMSNATAVPFCYPATFEFKIEQ